MKIDTFSINYFQMSLATVRVFVFIFVTEYRKIR